MAPASFLPGRMISAPVRCRAARFAARPCSGSYPPAPGRLRASCCLAARPPPRTTAHHSAENAAGLRPACFSACVVRCCPAPGRLRASCCLAARPPPRTTAHHSAENAAGLRPACFSVCVVRCCPAPGRLRASYCTLFPGKKKEGQSPLFFSPIYFASAGASTLPNSWPL